MMVQVIRIQTILCLLIFHSIKRKMIWYLNLAHQNSWKTIYSSISYALTHQKLVTYQLYSSYKIMVPALKTFFVIDWQHQNSYKSLSYSNLYSVTLGTNLQIILQQWQIMVQVWKILIIHCLKILHSTKSKMIW